MAAKLLLLKGYTFLFSEDITPHTSLMDSSTLSLALCVHTGISVLAPAHILLSDICLIVFLASLFCFAVYPELMPYCFKHHTS